MAPRSRPSIGPRSVFRLTRKQREAKSRAHEAVSLGREHRRWSASRAAREAGTTVSTIRRYAPAALERTPSGRLRFKARDRSVRIMPILSAGVLYEEVAVVGSRAASLVGRHWAAIGTFLSTGDDRALRALAGRHVAGTLPTGERMDFELEADVDVVAELAFVGELSDVVIES
ncbi:MAG TPA: hypothetical protein VEH29_02305 [Acidimicrobiales bacterium]|nr:hypothetical protein [Acidimicrobiales bacterium]